MEADAIQQAAITVGKRKAVTCGRCGRLGHNSQGCRENNNLNGTFCHPYEKSRKKGRFGEAAIVSNTPVTATSTSIPVECESGNESSSSEELIRDHLDPPSRKPPRQQRKQWERDVASRTQGSHFPFQRNNKYTKFGICSEDVRQRCKMCSRNTLFMCTNCNVFLCIESDAKFRNCYRDFHTMETFPSIANYNRAHDR